MSKPDYYQTLGIEKNSSESEIKKAYRKKAMKYHPDRNPDNKTSENKFKEAKEAYEILSDPQTRNTYDQFGHAGINSQEGMGGGFNSGDSFNDVFGDMFGDIFGGRRGGSQQNQSQRGSDLRYELTLDLEQAVFGDKVSIDIPSLSTCEPCNGSEQNQEHPQQHVSNVMEEGMLGYNKDFSRSNKPAHNAEELVKQ